MTSSPNWGSDRTPGQDEPRQQELLSPERPVVGVLADIPALDRTFDYLVPDGLEGARRVGTIVRIRLQGRPVRGWVARVGADPGGSATLDRMKPLTRITGHGPAPDLFDLASWAARRWAGRRVHLLRTASPPRAVRSLPPSRSNARASIGLDPGVTVWRRPPAEDPLVAVLEVARGGNVLIIAPSQALVDQLAAGLRREGHAVAVVPREWAQAAAGATVVGPRPAAWAPVVGPVAIMVVDEHDEAHQQQQAPTWHARDVAVERARRAGIPCVLVSPTPSLEALASGPVVGRARDRERAGWPVVDVIDRRDEQPGRGSLFSAPLARSLGDHRSGRVVCVLNRIGRSRLLACARCGELARCERCDAAVVELQEGRLDCRRCGEDRPRLCAACGSPTLKNLRLGVSRAREELEALVREPVGELTGSSGETPSTRVLVGTEAVLHRIDRAALIVFLDLDQELLAPRHRAAEQALALLARAARLLGGRDSGGRLLIQTRMPDHDVIQAALHGDPARLATIEGERRRRLRFPPSVALAAISGAGAEAFVAGLDPAAEVRGPVDGRWLVRAPDHETLATVLEAGTRGPDRVRVEVDPLRL